MRGIAWTDLATQKLHNLNTRLPEASHSLSGFFWMVLQTWWRRVYKFNWLLNCEFAMGPWHGSGPGGIACRGVLRVLRQAMCCPTATLSKVHTGPTGCSTLIDFSDAFRFLLPFQNLFRCIYNIYIYITYIYIYLRHLFSDYGSFHIF